MSGRECLNKNCIQSYKDRIQYFYPRLFVCESPDSIKVINSLYILTKPTRDPDGILLNISIYRAFSFAGVCVCVCVRGGGGGVGGRGGVCYWDKTKTYPVVDQIGSNISAILYGNI